MGILDPADWEARWISCDYSNAASTPLFRKELLPENFHELDGGKYVYDLGQNYAGWVRIKVKEARGL